VEMTAFCLNLYNAMVRGEQLRLSCPALCCRRCTHVRLQNSLMHFTCAVSPQVMHAIVARGAPDIKVRCRMGLAACMDNFLASTPRPRFA
jgi:hypothetical protein